MSTQVNTIEEASLIAGYEVAEPYFIPNNFYRNKSIILSQRGAGLPGFIEADFPVEVQQMWFWEEDDSVYFLILQTCKDHL